jgi:hypothetical protein
MGSERDIWAPDEDPWVARMEGALYALGASYLYHAAREAGEALGVRLDEKRLAEALRVRPLAKAPAPSREEAMARAERLYREALAGYDRLPPSQYRELAEAVTEKGMLRGGRKVGLDWRGLLGEREKERIAYVATRAMEYVRRLKEATRHALARAMLLWYGDGGGQPKELEARFLQEFGQLARDWRRVAITEVAHAGQGATWRASPKGPSWSGAPPRTPARCAGPGTGSATECGTPRETQRPRFGRARGGSGAPPSLPTPTAGAGGLGSPSPWERLTPKWRPWPRRSSGLPSARVQKPL